MKTSLFSERVDEAATKFRAAARASGCQMLTIAHPLRGPQGEELATDVAVLNPEARRMIVVVSGTHGIEGYCGSAIQTAYLQGLEEVRLPTDLGLLNIHLVNPWGCAWNRREDHENIDVFRNLLYRQPPFARNALYDEYEEGINPRSWTGPKRAHSDELYGAFIEEHGVETVHATIRRGQHDHPQGMTYHGRAASWSRLQIERIGRKFLAHATNVDVIDVHTGFGAPEEALAIACAARGSTFSSRIRSWFPQSAYSWGEDPLIPDHPQGPYHIWQELLGTPELNNVGLEFGTADVAEQFDLLRANTHIHTHGTLDSPWARQVTDAYRELFYPSSPQWRASVLSKGIDFIQTYVQRLTTERLTP